MQNPEVWTCYSASLEQHPALSHVNLMNHCTYQHTSLFVHTCMSASLTSASAMAKQSFATSSRLKVVARRVAGSSRTPAAFWNTAMSFAKKPPATNSNSTLTEVGRGQVKVPGGFGFGFGFRFRFGVTSAHVRNKRQEAQDLAETHKVSFQRVIPTRGVRSGQETSSCKRTRLCRRTAPARRSPPSARAHASGAGRRCRSSLPARAPTLRASYGRITRITGGAPAGLGCPLSRCSLCSTTHSHQATTRAATLEAGGRADAPPVSLPKAMSAEPSATATCLGHVAHTLQRINICLVAVLSLIPNAEAVHC